MKKLTRKQWERLQELEDLREERIEKECEKLAITKPIKERIKPIKQLFKKSQDIEYGIFTKKPFNQLHLSKKCSNENKCRKVRSNLIKEVIKQYNKKLIENVLDN